jgi:hypothetical protein
VRATLPDPTEDEHLALDIFDDPSSTDAERDEAVATVDAFLDRALETMAPPLLSAIERAIRDGLAPGPEVAMRWLATVRDHVEGAPRDLAGLGIARQLFSTAVGAETNGGLKRHLAITATPTIDRPAFAGLSTMVDGWLVDAYPNVDRSGPSPLSRGLRRFRLAVVWTADDATAAAAMAAEHPGLVPVAAALVERHSEVDDALDAFDRGLARAAAGRGGRPTPDDTDDSSSADEDGSPPGPRRRFTRYHLGFAVIIALLTVWHYVLR